MELDDWLRGNEVRWCMGGAGWEKSVAMPSRMGWETERDLPGDCSILLMVRSGGGRDRVPDVGIWKEIDVKCFRMVYCKWGSFYF